MTRKALIVGVDYYEHSSPLFGCVNDAHSVNSALERNSDGTLNFSTEVMTATAAASQITRQSLRQNVQELFSGNDEIALFYYAGHGFIEAMGGYLVTSECEQGSDGLSLNELVGFANASKAKNKIIVLDSCHSGIAGNSRIDEEHVTINVGVTILTASDAFQYAKEEKGYGVFTSLFVDALNGGAANLLGDITPGSVYAHIDQSLGPWEQRPLFKTNVTSFSSLKKVQPPVSLDILRKVYEYFPEINSEFQLDPSYEPKSRRPIEENTEILAHLQKLVKVNLVRPVGEEHMYFAAMNSKSCKLTVLGEHYWKLIKKGAI